MVECRSTNPPPRRSGADPDLPVVLGRARAYADAARPASQTRSIFWRKEDVQPLASPLVHARTCVSLIDRWAGPAHPVLDATTTVQLASGRTASQAAAEANRRESHCVSTAAPADH